MVTLKCGTQFNLKTSVVTKFLTGSLIMIYTFLTMALLLQLVESLEMTAPLTSPLWEQLVSENSLETSRAYQQLRPPIIIELNHKICYKPVIPRSARWRKNGVNWSSFTNEVESKMSNLPSEPNLSLRVSCFNDILISTATANVGKSKPNKRSKPWMTPHVRAKIRNCNRLHQAIHQNCQEWIDACSEANEAINEAKTSNERNTICHQKNER